jgi:pimeloyl-ACP methyl ester carboxylesterase
MVPDVRAKPDARQIPIRFLRFRSRSDKPGPPIVYLAGGPGASGIAAAAGPRWPLFDALRDVADVILLDQRGTGRAQKLPRCTTGDPVPLELPTTRENLVRVFSRQVQQCRTF